MTCLYIHFFFSSYNTLLVTYVRSWVRVNNFYFFLYIISNGLFQFYSFAIKSCIILTFFFFFITFIFSDFDLIGLVWTFDRFYYFMCVHWDKVRISILNYFFETSMGLSMIGMTVILLRLMITREFNLFHI